MLTLRLYDANRHSGGTSGCVIAGRLAENPDVTILVVEAGQHNEKLENTQMVGGSAISDSALMDPLLAYHVVEGPRALTVNLIGTS